MSNSILFAGGGFAAGFLISLISKARKIQEEGTDHSFIDVLVEAFTEESEMLVTGVPRPNWLHHVLGGFFLSLIGLVISLLSKLLEKLF